MRFVNENVYIDIEKPENRPGNVYVKYLVQIRAKRVPNSHIAQYSELFFGRAYCTDTGFRLYLNDILDGSLPSNNLLKESYKQGTIPPTSYRIGQSNLDGSMIFELSIMVEDWSETDIQYPYEFRAIVGDFYNGRPSFIDIVKIPQNVSAILNPIIVIDNTKLPVIPAHPGNNFWFGFNYIINQNFYEANKTQPLQLIGTKNDGSTTTFDTFNVNGYWPASGLTLSNYNFDGFDELYLNIGNSNMSQFSKIADIDNCPSDYYVIWVDRLGCIQCQPFNKRCNISETIGTQSVKYFNDIKAPYRKSIDYKFDLNTDWISKDYYKTFESLQVSPNIYLYDYKNNRGFYVTCDTAEFEYKTFKNLKRMFNYNVKLTVNKTENIIY